MGKTDLITRLAADATKFKSGMKDAEDANKKFAKSSEEAKDSADGLQGCMDKVGDELMKMAASWAKYFTAAAAASAAMKVVNDVFNRSETAIDAWGTTMEQGKAAYNSFLDTINGGDWANFFDNIRAAIFDAKELYGYIDRMGSVATNNQYAINREQAKLKELKLEKSQATDPARIAEIDKEAKVHIETLRVLLKEVTDSQLDAAKMSGRNAIASLYNSLPGAKISDEEADRLFSELINTGQRAFDKYDSIFAELKAKGTKQGSVAVPMGQWGTNYVEGDVFDPNNLNKADQHLYRLAYAAKEGETALKEAIGLAVSAQAGVGNMNTQLKEAYEIMNMQSKVSKGGGSSWMGGAIVDRTLGMGVGSIGTMTIGKLQPTDDALKNFEEWVLANPPIMPVDVIQPTQAAMEHFSKWVKDNPPAPLEIPVVVDPLKELKTTAEGIAGAFGAASGAIGQFSSESEAAAAIAKSFTIASAVATLVAQFAAIPKGAEIWSWIAGTIAGVGTLVGAVSTLKGFGYADGGVVKGNHFAGDAVPIMANAGEIVLNASQQQALASNLSQGGGGGGTMTLEIRGDKLVGAINNYGRGHGLGKVQFRP